MKQTDTSFSRNVKRARKRLASGGWSYRAAARHLGVSLSHLGSVLTGTRESKTLLSRIAELPPRDLALRSGN